MRGPAPVRDPYPGGRPPGATKTPLHPLTVPAAGLVALAVLTPLHGSWPVQLLMVVLLFTVPGVILLQALRVPGSSVAATPIYVPAASILVLTGSGLATDLIGPFLGIAAPLRAIPLLITLEIICAGLLLSAREAPPETQIPWSALERPVALAWPLVLPLIGAAGALRLNSGHSGHLAMIAVILAIAMLIFGFLRAPWYDDAELIVFLFAISLALLWSFSLRGNLVYGFDITSEYYSLNQTVTAGVWHFSHPNDAYGAMLSLTVFPTELHELSGVQTLLIFKAIYPAIGALFPVGVYCITRYLLVRRWAFLPAALIIMQQTFFQQLPALARQEVATFLFTALIAVLLDTKQARRSPGRWIFACLLSLGIVVSHYSTTYLAILLLALAIGYQFLLSWFRHAPRLSGVVVISFAVLTTGAVFWNGPITHSASNISQFEQLVGSNGIDLLPNKGGNPLTTYLQGEAPQSLSPAQYQSFISNYYRTNAPFIQPLPDASDPQYNVQVTNADDKPPVSIPSIYNGLNLAQLLVQQAVNLLAAIGALILMLRRKTHSISTPLGLFGLAGTTVLVLIRISGTIAQAYNPQRAFMQLLVVLAIGVCWIFQQLGVKYKHTRPWILAICSLSLGVFMVGSTGLSGAFLGGGTSANLANYFLDYQRFVEVTPDLAAGAWVLKEAPPGQIIQTDRYGQLRLATMAAQRQGIFGDVAPETIDRYAWVYATSTMLDVNLVQSGTGGIAAYTAFPKTFLDSNFNVVYTNGTSEVFHR
jgi:uncharacterized membrane protein